MPLVYNGTEINNVVYNGTTINTIVYNGTTIYTSSRTYKYKAKAIRCGTDALTFGNSSGVFRVDNQGGMWCFKDDTLDSNGSGITLAQCLAKNITSMKFIAYRANTNAASSAGTTGSAWTYGVNVSNGGITTIWSNTYNNRILRQLPTPSAVGLLDQGLTTSELQTIFSAQYLNNNVSASGSGIYEIPAGNYWAFGCKAQYSIGQIQFRCDNVNYDDAYIEIVA